MGDYVVDPYLYKISSRYDYSLRLPQICENAHQVTASFLVLLSAYSQDTCTDFYAQYVK